MAAVFRKTATKPLPGGAETLTRKGKSSAQWIDRRGKKRTAPLTIGRDSSPRIVVTSGTYTAKFRDGLGIVQEVATGCRSKDGAMAVLRDLMDRAEKIRAGIISPTEAAVASHQHVALPQHFEYLLNASSG